MSEERGGTYQELLDWLAKPPSDYGNHSCDNCTSKPRCPLVKFVPDTSLSIACSYYWPPNADKGPDAGYWVHLDEVARDHAVAIAEADSDGR